MKTQNVPSRTLSALLLGLVLTWGAVSTAMQAVPAKPSKLKWSHELEKSIGLAKKEKKLLLVDFNASWCQPCQMYKKSLFPTPEFEAAVKDVVLVDVDIDKQSALARKLKVGSIPDIRLLSPDGKLAGRVVGYDPKGLVEAIRKAKSSVAK